MEFKSKESRERHAANSRKISLARSNKIKAKYLDNPKKCKHCKIELTYEKRKNKFCDSSCAASFNNKGIIRNTGGYSIAREGSCNKNLPVKYCAYCGEKLSSRRKNHCNNICASSYNYLIYINKWLLGLEDGNSGKYGVSKRVRRYLFSLHGNKCQECGWGTAHPETDNIPLQTHHIDGDCRNNRFENLALLCPNCHVMTPNHGSRNKNCTRVDNRKRY